MSQCPKCKRVSGSGSLTQWIFGCTCQAAPLIPDTSSAFTQICSKCSLQIRGSGSDAGLTQWIFRCRCKQPEGIATETPPPVEAFEPPQVKEPPAPREEIEVDPSAFPLDRFAPYEIVGSGAGGTVYRCLDRLLKKEVAIKFLRKLTPKQQVAFQLEAKTTCQLQHRHIVRVLDFGLCQNEIPYMVLDFATGMTLEEIVEQRGALPTRKAMKVMLQVCSAVAYAHSAGVLHGDVKTANIIEQNDKEDDQEPNIRVIDFGLTTIRNQNTLMKSPSVELKIYGTPTYMPPDVSVGLDYDERSEIYSLGCLLFELLTGRPPFLADSTLTTLNMHATLPPPTLESVCPDGQFSEALEEIVACCLEKDPDMRFASVRELERALEKALVAIPSAIKQEAQAQPSIQTKPLAAPPPRMPYQAKVLIVMVVGLCIVSLGGIAAIVTAPKKSNTVEIAVTAPPPSLPSYGEFTTRDSTKVSGQTNIQTSATADNIVSESRSSLENRSKSQTTLKQGSDKDIERLLQTGDITKLSLNGGSYSGRALQALARLPIDELTLSSLDVTDKDFSFLKGLTNLEELSVVNCEDMTGSDLKFISNLPIEELELSGINIEDDDLKHLSTLHHIEELALDSCPNLTGSGLRHLADLDLEEMEIDHCNSFTAKGLDALKHMRLKELEIKRCPSFSDAGFDGIRGISVKELSIVSCPLFTGKHLDALAQSPLKTLIIHGVSLSEAGSIALTQLKSVEDLRLFALESLEGKNLNPGEEKPPPLVLPARALKDLANLPRLSALYFDLDRGTTSDDSIAYISKIKSLRELRLTGAKQIPASKLELLSALPDLRSIAFYGNKIDEKGWHALASIGSLTEIQAFGCDFSDSSCLAISKLPLRRLQVYDSPITIAGLQFLAPIKTLQLVELDHCPYVSNSDIARVAQKFPHCQFHTRVGSLRRTRS